VSLFVRPDAAADIEAAHFWYESQRPGLGDEFLDAILLVLEVLLESPRRYRVVHRDMRSDCRHPHVGIVCAGLVAVLCSCRADARRHVEGPAVEKAQKRTSRAGVPSDEAPTIPVFGDLAKREDIAIILVKVDFSRRVDRWLSPPKIRLWFEVLKVHHEGKLFSRADWMAGGNTVFGDIFDGLQGTVQAATGNYHLYCDGGKLFAKHFGTNPFPVGALKSGETHWLAITPPMRMGSYVVAFEKVRDRPPTAAERLRRLFGVGDKGR
jgi:plasmid stabilization system protein ParE